MVEKLSLPFPLLSDPDRTLMIEPMGVADPKDARNLSRPAMILIGGDETTRHVISGGMEALCRNPEACRRLAAEPSGISIAVEEMLRWVSPIANGVDAR